MQLLATKKHALHHVLESFEGQDLDHVSCRLRFEDCLLARERVDPLTGLGGGLPQPGTLKTPGPRFVRFLPMSTPNSSKTLATSFFERPVFSAKVLMISVLVRAFLVAVAVAIGDSFLGLVLVDSIDVVRVN